MLSGFWKNDPFSPEEESRLITSSSADGKLLEIPFNPVYRNFDKALRDITAGSIIDCVNRLLNFD
jgi:esterase FrsA